MAVLPPRESVEATSDRLRLVGIRKRFGATHALRGVDLRVRPGEIHALIGENGAGKSTLMKILSGACSPDAGEIHLEGLPFCPSDPLHARRSGICMIYQELCLAPHLSVEENILLGREPSRLGWIRRRERRSMARQALEQLGYADLPLDAPVSDRTPAEMQIVEIARAFLDEPRVLILDEPTSSLSGEDARRLFQVLRTLRDRGVSIIYISHFLEECQSLCDSYTVLRDGETVGTGSMQRAQLPDIIRLMVGRDVQEIYPRSKRQAGDVLLKVEDLTGAMKPRGASFELRRGEILGIAGLVGAGRTEMLRSLFGLDPMLEGTVSVHGILASRLTPSRFWSQGVGLLTESRKEDGLLLQRSIADNLLLTSLDRESRFVWLSPTRMESVAETHVKTLGVKAQSCWQNACELSGGNQQKVFLGRLIHHDADVLLLDEPTRGIDVGSKAEIYRMIHALADKGKAVVFVSSYLPELLGVCDSLAVMSRGTLGRKRPVEEWTEHTVMEEAIGKGQGE
ncbi:MAG: sugar ABC transporter ATP-binding protein [Verrucomicrobia bacterium]|nr:sugar ABC transporter ATP-binding protein [Verrucomicrobiota bacterium]